jgi:hypothetical protein
VTRPIRLALVACLVVLALAAAALLVLLPPRTLVAVTPAWRTTGVTVRGAYHVHSTASDGTGTLDEIAAAASRAGLRFVIVTDHGDGTGPPRPPQYRSGVLTIEGVEINTTGGHLVALGAGRSAYPLAGTPTAVLEDVHRLGGFGVAAHPASPRASLRWTDWRAPIDALEWMNGDNEWRDEPPSLLGRLFLTYPVRPAATLASILDRPAAALARWDGMGQSRPVAGLAGLDVHARLGFGQRDDPSWERWHLRLPGYEAAFRTFTTRVTLDREPSGDAVRDARAILERIGSGQAYTVIDAFAAAGAFEFWATAGASKATMGGYIPAGRDTALHVRAATPEAARLVVLRNGTALLDTRDGEIRLEIGPGPGVYRVEIYAPGRPGGRSMPWLVSNPIYAGLREAHGKMAGPGRRPAATRRGVAADRWDAEVSVGSASQFAPGARAGDGRAAPSAWRFSLADGAPAGQYAAVRFPVEGGLSDVDRLQLAARAERPMRLWVQVRAPSGGRDGERWGQTVYVDQTFRDIEVFFEDFQPVGATTSAAPALDRIDSLLLVVDTLNTRPSSSALIEIGQMWVAR